jgi:hypothetical protein
LLGRRFEEKVELIGRASHTRATSPEAYSPIFSRVGNPVSETQEVSFGDGATEELKALVLGDEVRDEFIKWHFRRVEVFKNRAQVKAQWATIPQWATIQ